MKTTRQHRRSVTTVQLLLALCCCAGLCAPTWAQESAAPQWEAGSAGMPDAQGLAYQMDPAASTVRIYAFRGGAARSFGHNHVLSAPLFTGQVLWPAQAPVPSHFSLEFRLDALALDRPEDRAALGAAFSTRLTPALVESTREHMLGPFNLQADRFPLVRIRSDQIAGEEPKFAARISVELHGQRQLLWVPLTVRRQPERLQVDGALVLLQSDFGVAPYALLGGLLAVQDALVVEFSLQAVASGK